MRLDTSEFEINVENSPLEEFDTGFVENTIAAYRSSVAVNQMFSADNAVAKVYDGYLAELSKMTGKEYTNPYDAVLGLPQYRGMLIERIEKDTEEVMGRDPDFSGATDEMLVDQAMADALATVSEEERVNRQATFAGDVGAFVGQAGAAITDPLMLLTLPMGATGATRLLGTVLIESLIGGATEAAIQPAVQKWRRELGLKSGPEEALKNIGVGAAAGGAFGGLFKVMSMGAKRLLQATREVNPNPTPAQRDAISQLEQEIAAQDASPPLVRGGDAEAAAEANRSNVIASDEAFREGRPVRGDELTDADLDASKLFEDVTARTAPSARFDLGDLTGARYRGYTPIRPGDVAWIQGVVEELNRSSAGGRLFLEQDGAGGTPQVIGTKSDAPKFFQDANRRINENNKERKRILAENKKLPDDQQKPVPAAQTVIKKAKVEAVANKLLEGKPLGAAEGGIAEELMAEARRLRTENAEQIVDYRAARALERSDDEFIDAIASREGEISDNDFMAGQAELMAPEDFEIGSRLRSGDRNADALAAENAVELSEDFNAQQIDAYRAEVDRIFDEDPDLEVFVGLNPDGKAQMGSAREIMEELDADEAFDKEFKGCVGL